VSGCFLLRRRSTHPRGGRDSGSTGSHEADRCAEKSVFFLTELALPEIPVKFDFLAIRVSGATAGTGGAHLRDLDETIEGEDVLLVEDIVDTGLTVRYLLQTLAGRQPNSLGICTFLDRTPRRLVQVPVRFRCFEIPDRFVVGFGLDYNQLYRNLGCVAVMKRKTCPSPHFQFLPKWR
jgi:hypoxanthine phosphoribosyltransferase